MVSSCYLIVLIGVTSKAFHTIFKDWLSWIVFIKLFFFLYIHHQCILCEISFLSTLLQLITYLFYTLLVLFICKISLILLTFYFSRNLFNFPLCLILYFPFLFTYLFFCFTFSRKCYSFLSFVCFCSALFLRFFLFPNFYM